MCKSQVGKKNTGLLYKLTFKMNLSLLMSTLRLQQFLFESHNMWEPVEQRTVSNHYGSGRFNCLVHVTVIPGLDVADMQNKMEMYLKNPYQQPDGLLRLLADPDSIRTTPVGKFLALKTHGH